MKDPKEKASEDVRPEAPLVKDLRKKLMQNANKVSNTVNDKNAATDANKELKKDAIAQGSNRKAEEKAP